MPVQQAVFEELAKLPSDVRLRVEELVFRELPAAPALEKSGDVERMKGYPNHYKVRVGKYRVGLRKDGEVVHLERVLHRRVIYRFFP